MLVGQRRLSHPKEGFHVLIIAPSFFQRGRRLGGCRVHAAHCVRPGVDRRADYLKAWWNTVNWNKVAERYAAAKAGTLGV